MDVVEITGVDDALENVPADQPVCLTRSEIRAQNTRRTIATLFGLAGWAAGEHAVRRMRKGTGAQIAAGVGGFLAAGFLGGLLARIVVKPKPQQPTT